MSLLASVKSKVQAARKALQTASGSVGDVRAVIEGLTTERARIASAAIPQDEAAPALREHVDRLIAGVTPQYAAPGDIIDAVTHGRPFDTRGLKPG